MADINNELNEINNAVYGKDVRGSIHDGIKKINEETESSTEKAEQAHDVMESIINDGFDNAALEANFEQKLDDKINALQPEWTQFKDDTVTQMAETTNEIGNKSTLPEWLQQSLRKVTKQLDDQVRDLGVNVKQPPFNAHVDGETDDTEILRQAISYAEEKGLGIYIPGVSVITGELEVKKSIRMVGCGTGSGYGGNALTRYKQTSGFLVKGSGKKRVRTRANFRGNESDPQDAPLSVVLNIQAENVVLNDFTVFLDFDKTDNSPDNYGADWDVGIFLGCRVHNTFDNVHVLGYWREASILLDVTRSSNLPEFNDLKGIPYDKGSVTNGADGLTLENVYTKGGKWGLKIQGAKPKPGESGYSSDYYDEILGYSLVDERGRFGASDLTAIACSFYGTDHHSKYRRDDSTGDYLTDNGGGAMSIDGMAGNSSGAIQGMRFISTRFSTWEPFRIKLDRVNRPIFIGCHSEWGSGGLTSFGENIGDEEYYGPISTTENTNNVVLIGFNSSIRNQYIGVHGITNIAPSSSDTSMLINAIIRGELDVQSIIKSSNELDLRGSEGVRLRKGDVTAGFLNDEYSTFYPSIAVRPNTDNNVSLGQANRRFSNIFAGTGTINTSDRNEKQQIISIEDRVLEAWEEVNYSQFKFNDAVKEKGEQARWHIGVIAQEIEDAFAKRGLNAFDYGLLCYDEWDDIYERNNQGDVVLVMEAGARYSIRPDECLMLESALMRKKLESLGT